MLKLSSLNSSIDINFEVCGRVLIAPQKKLCAFVCNVCEDVFQFMPQFMRHLYSEHDDEFSFYESLQENYAFEELLTDFASNNSRFETDPKYDKDKEKANDGEDHGDGDDEGDDDGDSDGEGEGDDYYDDVDDDEEDFDDNDEEAEHNLDDDEKGNDKGDSEDKSNDDKANDGDDDNNDDGDGKDAQENKLNSKDSTLLASLDNDSDMEDVLNELNILKYLDMEEDFHPKDLSELKENGFEEDKDLEKNTEEQKLSTSSDKHHEESSTEATILNGSDEKNLIKCQEDAEIKKESVSPSKSKCHIEFNKSNNTEKEDSNKKVENEQNGLVSPDKNLDSSSDQKIGTSCPDTPNTTDSKDKVIKKISTSPKRSASPDEYHQLLKKYQILTPSIQEQEQKTDKNIKKSSLENNIRHIRIPSGLTVSKIIKPPVNTDVKEKENVTNAFLNHTNKLGKQITLRRVSKRTDGGIENPREHPDPPNLVTHSNQNERKRKPEDFLDSQPVNKKMKAPDGTSGTNSDTIQREESSSLAEDNLESGFNESDCLDVVKELISQVQEGETSDCTQNNLSDLDLMSQVGFKWIVSVRAPAELTAEEKSKALEMAKLIQNESYLWATKGNSFKIQEQINESFAKLTAATNRAFSCDFSVNNLKRIFNLITLWYNNQRSEELNFPETDKFFDNILSFIPKASRKMFYCEYCAECFCSEVKYLVHNTHHTGRLPYSCKYCDRSFKAKASLIRHEGTHPK